MDKLPPPTASFWRRTSSNKTSGGDKLDGILKGAAAADGAPARNANEPPNGRLAKSLEDSRGWRQLAAPPPPQSDCLAPLTRNRLTTLGQIAEDWLYLALLGIIMALLSFSMDSIITLFLNTRLWLTNEMEGHHLLVQYLAWCMTPILLVTFSTGFVHLCSPTAIGSGIPEMKTILRGVVLNEYLTFRTLVAKIVGLTFTLGSGLPLGKEGPFVHVASIVATLLSKLVASFQGIYENESRTSEMLSAACAVGVAATFYAPIGGVLFSIEVTTVYFAVRNYWRGFFAACCGATIWRLLGFWIKNDESISALFKTNFNTDYPFDPIELLVYSFIGATCGLAGAAYIKFHRNIVQFFRRHKRISGFLQQNRFVYPTLVTLIITTSTFPPLLGQYTASTLGTHTTIEHLFSNRTWGLGSRDLVSRQILNNWTTPQTSFYTHLVLYIVMLFWTSALASTIPTPSGVFIPVLKMGAAYGRLLGELMAYAYPNGIKYSPASAIVPGSYAVVGAAAFSGAVTHTVSTSVILFEMTGQIVHIIPVILGVLIANAVCQSLQPSIYDSIIEIKKLPYLPPIASSNSISHRILVRDFMNTNMPYVWKHKCTYADLKLLLSSHKKIISFPLVESPDSMKLLGSIARPDLLKLLYLHLGRERRLQEVCRRNSDTFSPVLQMFGNAIKIETRPQPPPACNESTRSLAKLELDEPSAGDADENSPDCGLEFKSNLAPPPSPGAYDCNGHLATISGNSLQTPRRKLADKLTKLTAARAASGPPFNYGATEADAVAVDLTAADTIASRANGKKFSLSLESAGPGKQVPDDERLLSDCRKESPSDQEEEADKFELVAKIVNHYNRGSTMDDDQVDRCTQEVEDRIAVFSKYSPEIIVSVCEKPLATTPEADGQKTESNCGNKLTHQVEEPQEQPSSGKQLCKTIEVYQRALAAQKAAGGNNRVGLANVPSSLSLGRPTKSILKTSSFNNMARRNTSSQSFSSSLGVGSGFAATGSGNGSGGADATPNQLDAYKLSIGSAKSASISFGVGEHLERQAASVRQRRKVRLPRLRVVDMTPEEQQQWEKEQLNAHIDLSKCQIDEAPFQLVEQTSLYRVHTLFSMLGLNHAYVTSFGRLVGIVALKDIRYALEEMLQEKK